jgi:glycosyltransferase involved in cell wall biosynthesis
MNILWFSWKDTGHPESGGAELISSELRKRLAKDGHVVRLITAQYQGSSAHETIDGVEIYRIGNRFTVYLKAFFLFRKDMKNWPDLIIDEMNTIPFGCAIYSRRKSALLTYQLARRVWFYQLPFPFSWIGYLLEPFYLFLLSRIYHTVLTESESTKNDLARFGFKKENIHVFRAGMSLEPLKTLPPKNDRSAVLSLGALRPMKRTLDIVKAFEIARDNNSSLELLVAGDASGKYANKVIHYVGTSRHKAAIQILGRVSGSERLRLMKTSAIIVVTSIKEGWGLIVTEANSQGTPAIAYNTDGLRDSVLADKTGVLVPSSNTNMLGNAINQLLHDKAKYDQFRHNGWEYSKQFTFENSYSDFTKYLDI